MDDAISSTRNAPVMRLSRRDSEAVANALLDPDPQPNAALRRAARAHDAYTGRDPAASGGRRDR